MDKMEDKKSRLDATAEYLSSRQDGDWYPITLNQVVFSLVVTLCLFISALAIYAVGVWLDSLGLWVLMPGAVIFGLVFLLVFMVVNDESGEEP